MSLAPIIDTRGDQMFPTLTKSETDRLVRFGGPEAALEAAQ